MRIRSAYLILIMLCCSTGAAVDHRQGDTASFEAITAPANLIRAAAKMLGAEPAGAPTLVTSGTQVNEFNDQFGQAMVIADFTGDGRGDLAIGVPFEDIGSTESSGSVLIYRGTGSGLVYHQSLTQAGLGADEPFDHFGYALAAGDFDGNGTIDLAVGAPDEGPSGDPASGAVFVFNGGASLTTGWVIEQESLGTGTNAAGDRFGEALCAGDFFGTDATELAIGAPGDLEAGVRSGRVHLATWNVSGPIGAGTVAQSSLSTPQPYERFGSALASGNFFGSSRDELAVGAYGDIYDAATPGAVFIYRVSGGALVTVARLFQSGLNESKDLFGRSLSVGDFDADGWEDLAVGAPGENRRQGAVYLFQGSVSELSAGQVIDGASAGAVPGDTLGWTLAAADIDGDGDSDLVAGSPRARLAGVDRTGRSVWYRSTNGVLSSVSPLTQTYFSVGETDDNFSASLAAGDLGNDGSAEVAIGAPREPVGQRRVGSVYVFRGVNGADPAAWRRIVQAQP